MASIKLTGIWPICSNAKITAVTRNHELRFQLSVILVFVMPVASRWSTYLNISRTTKTTMMARQVIPDTIPTMIAVCQSSVVLFGDTILLGSDVANAVDCIETMLIV